MSDFSPVHDRNHDDSDDSSYSSPYEDKWQERHDSSPGCYCSSDQRSDQHAAYSPGEQNDTDHQAGKGQLILLEEFDDIAHGADETRYSARYIGHGVF